MPDRHRKRVTFEVPGGKLPYGKARTTQVRVHLQRETYQALKAECRRLGIQVSPQIRAAIAAMLKVFQQMPTPDTRKQDCTGKDVSHGSNG